MRLRRGVWPATIGLVWALTAGCTDDRPAAEYWPTAGWRTASPDAQGVDRAAFTNIESQVASTFTEVRSVLVVRHGYLVYEHYWHGLDASSGHDVRSVTKSVVGTLVGMAIADGKIAGLDQTVGQLLPGRLPPEADPRLATVTVKQLLTMTSGLAGDPSGEDAMWASPDWVRQILGQQLITRPGSHFTYSSAGSHLLSAIVSTAVGQPTLDYARAKLFTPLGIDTGGAYQPVLRNDLDAATLDAYKRASVAWPVDPQGYHYGGAFLKLPARDLAKLGYLYLHQGRWDGRQLIPADYVAAATTEASASSGYGFQWWVGMDGRHRTFRAEGLGGQFIYVVPDLDLVTVVTNAPEEGPNPRSLLTVVTSAAGR